MPFALDTAAQSTSRGFSTAGMAASNKAGVRGASSKDAPSLSRRIFLFPFSATTSLMASIRRAGAIRLLPERQVQSTRNAPSLSKVLFFFGHCQAASSSEAGARWDLLLTRCFSFYIDIFTSFSMTSLTTYLPLSLCTKRQRSRFDIFPVFPSNRHHCPNPNSYSLSLGEKSQSLPFHWW